MAFEIKHVDNIKGDKQTILTNDVSLEKCPDCSKDLRTTGKGRYCIQDKDGKKIYSVAVLLYCETCNKIYFGTAELEQKPDKNTKLELKAHKGDCLLPNPKIINPSHKGEL